MLKNEIEKKIIKKDKIFNSQSTQSIWLTCRTRDPKRSW